MVWLLPSLVTLTIVGLGKRIKWSDFEAGHPPTHPLCGGRNHFFQTQFSIFPPPRNRFKLTAVCSQVEPIELLLTMTGEADKVSDVSMIILKMSSKVLMIMTMMKLVQIDRVGGVRRSPRYVDQYNTSPFPNPLQNVRYMLQYDIHIKQLTNKNFTLRQSPSNVNDYFVHIAWQLWLTQQWSCLL